jgi:hypothetical protein
MRQQCLVNISIHEVQYPCSSRMIGEDHIQTAKLPDDKVRGAEISRTQQSDRFSLHSCILDLMDQDDLRALSLPAAITARRDQEPTSGINHCHQSSPLPRLPYSLWPYNRPGDFLWEVSWRTSRKVYSRIDDIVPP